MNSKSGEDHPCHVRTCHMCGHINESKEQVARCEECGKIFAPFFYFSEAHVSTYTDNGLRPPDFPGELRPLRGLTALWKEGA